MDYNMIGTAWSLLPPLVAIALALKTKEVYSSLFIGIVVGALLAIFRGFDVGGLAAFLQYSRQFGRPINELASLYDVNVNLMIFKLNEMHRMGMPIRKENPSSADFFRNIDGKDLKNMESY